jgi:predicted ATPase
LAAYRDNEVSLTHPLTVTLAEIQQAGAIANNIVLQPLQIAHINQLVSDTLRSELLKTKSLAQLVFNKTQGNPFFLTQLLKSLYQENLLSFDFSQGGWQWDIDRLQGIDITDNVVELMVSQIQKLSQKTQNVLRLAACIGNKFTLDVLGIVHQKSQSETAKDLWEALQADLVVPLNDSYKIPLVFDQEAIIPQQDPAQSPISKSLVREASRREDSLPLRYHQSRITYQFLHDRVQQAAYSLIPDDQKKETHLKIGQLLLQNTTPEEREENIFDLVNQLNYGSDLLTPESEKYELAQLNLIAGQKAKVATAYESALKYLTVGLDLLAASSWQSQYELALALHNEAAEVTYLNGDFEQMERLAEVVRNRAKTVLDKVKVYEVKIQAEQAQHKLLEAVSTALQILKLLGVEFPEKPNPLDIQRGLEETASILSGKRIEELIDLPQMTNPYKLAAIRLLLNVFISVYMSVPELFPLVVLKQVNLSIKHGNASVSPYGYANYGLFLCGVGGDIDSGYRFGQLALSLVSKLNAKEISARTSLVVNVFVRPWKEHLRETLKPLHSTYSTGLETGDLEYAAFGLFAYCNRAYFAGKELAELEREMAIYRDAISKLKQESALHYHELYWQTVLNLIGKNENPCHLKGEAYDEQIMLALHQKAKDSVGLYYLYINKLQLCYLFQEYAEGN